jgi:hypothetical protein
MDTQVVCQFFMCLPLEVRLESKTGPGQLVKERMREERLKKLMKTGSKHDNLPMILPQLYVYETFLTSYSHLSYL